MKYMKRGSRVLVGNAAIPKDLIAEYIGTLCFVTSDFNKGKQEFVNLSLTRQQLEEVRDAIEQYLVYTDKYPPYKERAEFLKD